MTEARYCGKTRARRCWMTREIKFPRDFGGLLLEFAEVFGLEIGDVHQDAVRDAGVGDRLPGIDDFRGEFDLAVSDNARVAKFNFFGESLFETERNDRQKKMRLPDNLPLEAFFESRFHLYLQSVY